MDKKIDEVVTEDIEFPKIIIEGEGEVGKEPDRIFDILDQLLQPVECKTMESNAGFADDIRVIIELEGDMKSIAVGDKSNSSHHANSHKMFQSKRVRFKLGFRFREDF